MDAGPFTGRLAFVAALREAIITAAAQGCREMFWLDASFVDWPLSDVEVLAALSSWARPPHGLHLLALDFEALRLRHPRFVAWRTAYGHCVQARAVDPDLAASFNSGGAPAAALLAAPLSLRLFETQNWRGAVSLAPQDVLRTRERFDAMAQRSCESFAATTLGL